MLSFTDLAVSLEAAVTYASAAEADTSTLQDTDLMRGQRYIAARFNGRWREPFDADSVPEAVQLAIIEAGLVEAKTPGILSPMSTPATDKVLVGAGKLQWERLGGGGPDSYVPRLAIVEGLLAPLVRSGSTSFLMRA